MADINSSDSKRRLVGGALILPAISTVLIFCLLFPVFAVVWLAFHPSENIWPHLVSTTLPRYLGNSIALMVNVGFLTVLIGVPTAWLVVMKEFPGRKIFQWALLLPLAVPAYIGAYAFVDFWEYAGPFQTWLRGLFGWTTSRDYWFPEMRSRWAASLVLSLSLYPYVFLLARSAFRQQSARALDVSRALGCGPWGSFWRVGVPMARPAIFAGVAIALMETLNDFGTVEYFSVQTLTTGIFSVWLEARNVGGAAQLASLVLTLILCLLVAERLGRGRSKYTQQGVMDTSVNTPQSVGWIATVICAVPVVLGFVMPVGIFLSHAFHDVSIWFESDLLMAVWRTVWVSAIAAAIAISTGLLVTTWSKLSEHPILRVLAPLAMLGYAIPGAVLGLGILIPLARIDHIVADLILSVTGTDPGLIFTGTAGAIIFAYVVRFFALAFGGIDSAYSRVSPNLGTAARSLGARPMSVFSRVYAPLIKGSVFSAALLLFVDSVKELPATLLLRPIGFDTLATHVYESAGLEDIAAASVGSLVIVAVSVFAVLILARANR